MKREEQVSWALYWFGIGFILWCLSQAMGCGDPALPVCELPETDSVSAYVVDGVQSVDRRSTVSLNDGVCTGTVVGEFTVLTAAHCGNVNLVCIQDLDTGEYVKLPVVARLFHPDYVFPQHDLQLLYTNTSLPEPYAQLGTPNMCSSLLVQGYGYGSGGDLHEREVYELVRSSGIFTVTEGICNGDSGGPLWGVGETTNQLGVASFGYGEPYVCTGRTGFVDLQVDGHPEWLEENIR